MGAQDTSATAPAPSPDTGSTKPAQPHDPSDDLATWLGQIVPALGAAITAPLAATMATAAAPPSPPGMSADATDPLADDTPRGGAAQRALQALLSQTAAPSSVSTGPQGTMPASGSAPTNALLPAATGTSTSGAAPVTQVLAESTQGSDSGTGGTASDAATQAPSSAPDAASASAGADPLQAWAAVSHLSPATPVSTRLDAVQTALRTTVGTAEWVDELGGQLTWMAHHGIGSASLQVSPPDLGPIEARISLHGSEASVWFGAAQADTRAALEQALPRLRELFGAQGLALADAGVSREPPRQQSEQARAPAGTSGAARTTPDSGVEASDAIQSVGLLDLYA